MTSLNVFEENEVKKISYPFNISGSRDLTISELSYSGNCFSIKHANTFKKDRINIKEAWKLILILPSSQWKEPFIS